MYRDWCEEFRASTGFTGLGRKYDRNRRSVAAYARRHRWEERYQIYQSKAQENTETTLIERHGEKLKQMRGLGTAALRSLYVAVPDPTDPTGKRKVFQLATPAKPGEVVTIFRYEDDLMEKFPEQSNEAASNMTEEQIAASLQILTSLGAAVMEAIGKFIVEKGHRLDKERQPQEEADSPDTH